MERSVFSKILMWVSYNKPIWSKIKKSIECRTYFTQLLLRSPWLSNGVGIWGIYILASNIVLYMFREVTEFDVLHMCTCFVHSCKNMHWKLCLLTHPEIREIWVNGEIQEKSLWVLDYIFLYNFIRGVYSSSINQKHFRVQ